jgi:hypothetical protein
MRSLKKLKIYLPYDLFNSSPKKMVSKRYLPIMLLATRFMLAEIWNQPSCPLTDEWIKDMWNVYAKNIIQSE